MRAVRSLKLTSNWSRRYSRREDAEDLTLFFGRPVRVKRVRDRHDKRLEDRIARLAGQLLVEVQLAAGDKRDLAEHGVPDLSVS